MCVCVHLCVCYFSRLTPLSCLVYLQCSWSVIIILYSVSLPGKGRSVCCVPIELLLIEIKHCIQFIFPCTILLCTTFFCHRLLGSYLIGLSLVATTRQSQQPRLRIGKIIYTFLFSVFKTGDLLCRARTLRSKVELLLIISFLISDWRCFIKY